MGFFVGVFVLWFILVAVLQDHKISYNHLIGNVFITYVVANILLLPLDHLIESQLLFWIVSDVVIDVCVGYMIYREYIGDIERVVYIMLLFTLLTDGIVYILIFTGKFLV